MVYSIVGRLISNLLPIDISQPNPTKNEGSELVPFSEADLIALARAADDGAKLYYPSPKINILIHSERVGTRGFWETIEGEQAKFGNDRNTGYI